MIDGISPEYKKTCCPCNGPQPGDIVHLPVAPQIVARTRFSAPPPRQNLCCTSAEALELLAKQMEERNGKVAMAAITGPGDPLATPELTIETTMRIKERFPELPVGLLTMGIGSAKLAGDLARAGIEYVEMRVEGVRVDILEKLFAWIRPGAKTLKLSEAAALLLKEQSSGVSALTFHNIKVSILTTLYPGYNLDHSVKISAEMVELGADSMSLIPYSPEPGAEVYLECPSKKAVADAATKASSHLKIKEPLLYLGTAVSQECMAIGLNTLPCASAERPNVAVVSSNGMEVDLHLGHAIQFLIYGPRSDGLACLLETRNAPEPGSGAERWHKVAETLKDCFILLTASAGETPRKVLTDLGLRVYITEENIEGMVDVLYGGGKKKKKHQRLVQ